ncbi:DUF2911 domain-containing protein [Winogradskyella sp.]|jgi:hypothetical protein|uniref:DUF2911 domain-containing protein n=1 Tax=Winogradskyella sp. TaxID=1883156 RepID=UPI0025E1F7E3|nr:DUF2911 domain-containing protein [Winogradskyella sp.]MCT4630837.1 DUF2911 domain-containing protein [Winogradskyella sp.]
MKTTRLISAIAFAFTLLLSFNAEAQKFSELDKSPMDASSYPSNYKESNKLIKIVYSRPQLKGREVYDLAKPGKVWRLGANEAAELNVYTDMELNGTKIEKGTYTVYAIPGEKEWTIIVSTDLNVWGSYFYDEKNDVARITVPTSEGSKSLEAFSIAFKKSDDGIHMHMGWGTVRVAVPFKK